MRHPDRRQFLIRGACVGAALALGRRAMGNADSQVELAVVRNGSPSRLVRSAVDALGGMERFVRQGQTVLIKPNIGWDRMPEQAATTNPEAVAEVVRLCIEAGAKRVRVLDRTCNNPRRCYKRSGIEAAAESAGAEVRHVVDGRLEQVSIPEGQMVKSWSFYRDIFEADVFINMPIAKTHSVSGVTLGFKNVMGLLGGDRGMLHKDFDTKIVDINLAVQPALTLVDAYRVLMRNGPSGGNLADVDERKTIIAGTDRVAVDAYALRLFDLDPARMNYLQNASARGLGQIDPGRVANVEIDLGDG